MRQGIRLIREGGGWRGSRQETGDHTRKFVSLHLLLILILVVQIICLNCNNWFVLCLLLVPSKTWNTRWQGQQVTHSYSALIQSYFKINGKESVKCVLRKDCCSIERTCVKTVYRLYQDFFERESALLVVVEEEDEGGEGMKPGEETKKENWDHRAMTPDS